MRLARITAKGQTTIPISIRKAAHIHPGDTLAFEINGDHLIARKINVTGNEYLQGVQEALGEQSSPEDRERWNALWAL
ncbi:MAG: AbrB/MazE/SpoVT family DNA-binding domain-containing protein [Chlorobiaceae bacterium]